MLLEAAMAELREASSDAMLHDDTQSESPNFLQDPGNSEGQPHLNVIEAIDYTPEMDNQEQISLLQDNTRDESTSSNAGSLMSDTSPNGDSNKGGISLLHDDNEFVSRVLNREPSNLGESSRFGSYRSTAAVAAGGVPFQWEAEPGKSKSPTIKEEEEELPPLSLPPIRLSATTTTTTHKISPASSAAPSPRSLTGKMKSLIINHVKKPSMDHFSFTSILEPQKSPSKKSSHRTKRERKHSSLSASEHGSIHSSSVTASPYNYNSASFKDGNMQKNEELHGPRSSLNSSDPSSSPYYFSPLSNSSSLMGQGILSPRASVTQSLSGSIISNTHSHASVSSHTSSRGSDSSISSVTSSVNAHANGPAVLANCLLSVTSMSNVQLPPAEFENGDHENGSNSVSFASPEMEMLDEGLLGSANYTDSIQQTEPETSMEAFINRGGPPMNRSLSTSRVTFADDLYRKVAQKSKYYSGQLSKVARSKSTRLSSMQDPRDYTANLDVLFPLKQPNNSKASAATLVPKYINQREESPDDRQAYVDALDTSLDSSVMTDTEELNSMVQSIMNHQLMIERPAHEVVMPNDENGFAYSPVASAFVFSPQEASQNAVPAKHYFKPSTRANISHGSNGKDHHFIGQPKSILKKTYSQELNRRLDFDAKTAARDSLAHPPPYVQQKSLTHSRSQKISSVLLRFAETEEHTHNSKKHHQHQGGMRSPACMQPMCSFLGRAFLCRSKLASRLHS